MVPSCAVTVGWIEEGDAQTGADSQVPIGGVVGHRAGLVGQVVPIDNASGGGVEHNHFTGAQSLGEDELLGGQVSLVDR